MPEIEVIWHISMSLDGLIAGPDDSMDWAFNASGPNQVADEVMRETGAILAGRRWYDAQRPRNTTASLGSTTECGPDPSRAHAPAGRCRGDSTVTFVSDGLKEAVAMAQDAAEGKNVVIFGANTVQQCLGAGLIDEIVIHPVPVLLSDDVRLYGAPGAERVDLKRIAALKSGQVVDLRFEVRK